MHLIDMLEEKLSNVLAGLGYSIRCRLEISARPDLGDYQFNGSFNLAKEYHKSPIAIADEIVAAIKDDSNFKAVSNAGGFVNLSLSDDALIKYVNECLKDSDINRYKLEKKLLLLDYGGANIAKELHVGHLRSANIGEARKRLFAYSGYETISDVHFGDWGRPMGLIIREIKERMPDLPYFKEDYDGVYNECPIKIEDLNDIYPLASARGKEDEVYLNEAREITTLLQSGHQGYFNLWKSFYELSKEDIKGIYRKLNATFDLFEGEYDCDQYIPEMMKYLSDNNLTEISEGATVINVKKEDDNREIPPVILIKSDGGVLYDTTEMATLYSRMKRFKPDLMFYMTDIRQELHFEMAFRAAYKTKIVPESVPLEFLGFGTMNGPDGKPFKTRDGNLLSLKGLIEMVTKECRKVIKDNIKEEDKDALAEELAVAAIKYADLLPNPTSDYIFDPVKFSDLNGKTGPYLLYSTVRMNSLINKCSEAGVIPGEYKTLGTKEEREIILNILKIKSILEKCVTSRCVNELADFVYKLTNSFNAFYGEHEVLIQKDKEMQESWITLTKLVYDTNKTLLDILALRVPDKI